jgi:broad specificity phosphatase PhoE
LSLLLLLLLLLPPLQLCHVLQKRYAYFDAVVSSDLQRTLQTAQILAAPYQLQVMTVITVVPSNSVTGLWVTFDC